jgi:hypothetical protein
MQAVGEGPIAFVDADGKQHAIPLSAITFEEGVVQSAVVVDGLQEWMEYLVLQGQLVSGPTAAAVAAMIVEAKNEGPTGNNIVVEVRDLGGEVVEIRVTEAHLYEGLSFDSSEHSVSAVLDVSEKGIVHQTDVTGTSTDVPVSGLVSESELPPDDRAGWILEDSGGASLAVLEPRGADWDKGELTVVVTDVDPAAATFNLEVAWQITRTVGPTDDLTAANSPLADLQFSVAIIPPPGAQLRLPMPGRVALMGGAARVPATPPKKARVTLFADE